MNEFEDDKDEDNDEIFEHKIKHVHQSFEKETEYGLEVILSGVNKYVYLKSNSKSDDLQVMSKLAFKLLSDINQMEKE